MINDISRSLFSIFFFIFQFALYVFDPRFYSVDYCVTVTAPLQGMIFSHDIPEKN